jgi:hypothetical protein
MPNQKQRQKMVRIIESEPFLAYGDLVVTDNGMCRTFHDDDNTKCEGVGHCAIGALLFASGVSNKRLERVDGDVGSLTRNMKEILKEDYGMEFEDIDFIMKVNDSSVYEHASYADNWSNITPQEEIENRRNHVINAIYAL